MNREIPGFYYDAEKKKYFKIEKSQTAPSSAAWSSEAVKRRKIQDSASEAARQRAHLLRRHIHRHELARDVVSSGLLARELGLPPTAERGRGRVGDGDIGAAAWAGGVVAKGGVPFAPSFARARLANMPCFYVGGEDGKTGLGVAYATLDEETLVGSYIPMDDNDAIRFSREAPTASGRALAFRTEMIRCPQMSSIKYHRPSHRILLTSREPDHSCGLYFFSPPVSDPGSGQPHWLLGETSHYQRLSIRQSLREEWLVHSSTPAPASSPLVCVIGTNSGILSVMSNETMSWITPPGPSPKGVHLPQEIFAQDFQQGNHNVLLAGGRQPKLWITDLRAPVAEWKPVPQRSSLTHLRSVNEHQVLTSGLRSSMALYDLRFLPKRPNGARPVLTFPEHKNEAHFHIGWDVCPSLSVVASAQDDGTVKLFSLASGRRLHCRGVAPIKTETPIKALMFQTMPRERLPSLFIGEGPELRKFSFGAVRLEDEA